MTDRSDTENFTDPVAWAEQTFGACQLGDIRRRDSVVELTARAAANPNGSISEMYGADKAGAERAYYMLENDNIGPHELEQPAFEETARRCRQEKEVVVAIQDGTTLHYSHSAAAELGELGSGRGFLVHSTLAVRASDRRILGLLDQNRWIRPDERPGKHERQKRAYRDKESFEWEAACRRNDARLGIHENLITVCDREADIYEFLGFLQATKQRFVVRANHDRKLATADGTTLWEHMARQPVLGTHTMELEQRGPQRATLGRPARKARKEQTRCLALRAARVTLLAPQRSKGSLEVNVVYVSEPEPPEQQTPIEWMLVTLEPIATTQDTLTIIRYYECRWLIEEFHKVWKSGCRIEESRLQHADNLERWAVITAHIAARMLALRFLAASEPERPCSEIFTTDEWQCLYACSHSSKRLPTSPPSVGWALLAIAKLGGWHDTKRTGIPGWQSLWRGWMRLYERFAGWMLARSTA
jgi:hypothetical protein